MANRSADFPSTFKSTLYDVFEVTWNKKLAQYQKVFDVNTTMDQYEDILQYQGPDAIPQGSEGSVFERVEHENIRSKRYSWTIYKGEIKVTREMLDDCKYPQVVASVKQLAVAATRTIERMGAAFFYNGLSGAEESPDGVAVFHDSHPLANPLGANPTLCSNLGTGTLSNMNIRNARILGRRTRDEHGSISPFDLTQLITGPDLEDEGEVQRKSDKEPGVFVNDKNVSGPKISEHIVLDYLAEAPANSTTMWFLRDPEMARNKFFWRVRPERSILKDPDSDDHLFRIYFRCGLGCDDWRGLFGSAGTGSADALGATVR